MSSVTVVETESFCDAVRSIVETNIEENEKALKKNLDSAANAAKAQLKRYKGDWVGWEQLGHSRGFHAKFWRVYKERAGATQGIFTDVVASAAEPMLTHLLEFGHRVYIGQRRTNRQTWATHYMSAAYLKGRARLLEACHVDNP